MLMLALVLTGCGFRAEKLFASYSKIDVREVGRSLYCNSGSEEPQAQILPDLKAVQDWQRARGVTFPAAGSLVQSPYALIEMGQRPTGGYGLAVARSAVLRGELVILSATFLSPSAGSIRSQALTSPCALVQLPPGRYTSVELQDPSGTTRATGGIGSAPPPSPKPQPPEVPAQPEPPAPTEAPAT